MSLMGPGAMTEYSAPSRGRRARGTVYVDDPAVGFFVAGSSLTEMNGIYTRRNDHGALPGFRVALCYGHSGKNGWHRRRPPGASVPAACWRTTNPLQSDCATPTEDISLLHG